MFINQHKVNKLIKKASKIEKYNQRIEEIFNDFNLLT
jgi:hypothetical protein